MCGIVYLCPKDPHLIQYIEHGRKYKIIFSLCYIFVSFSVAALKKWWQTCSGGLLGISLNHSSVLLWEHGREVAMIQPFPPSVLHQLLGYIFQKLLLENITMALLAAHKERFCVPSRGACLSTSHSKGSAKTAPQPFDPHCPPEQPFR